MTKHDSLLEAAERIASLLAGQGVDAVVIGAAALAAHHYVRHTEDIDLGVALAGELEGRKAGWSFRGQTCPAKMLELQL